MSYLDQARDVFKQINPKITSKALDEMLVAASAKTAKTAEYATPIKEMASDPKQIPIEGEVNLDKIRVAIEQAHATGWPATAILINRSGLVELVKDKQLDLWFDPVSRLEILTTGWIGTLIGLTVWTDVYFPEEYQCIETTSVLYGPIPNKVMPK